MHAAGMKFRAKQQVLRYVLILAAGALCGGLIARLATQDVRPNLATPCLATPCAAVPLCAEQAAAAAVVVVAPNKGQLIPDSSVAEFVARPLAGEAAFVRTLRSCLLPCLESAVVCFEPLSLYRVSSIRSHASKLSMSLSPPPLLCRCLGDACFAATPETALTRGISARVALLAPPSALASVRELKRTRAVSQWLSQNLARCQIGDDPTENASYKTKYCRWGQAFADALWRFVAKCASARERDKKIELVPTSHAPSNVR